MNPLTPPIRKKSPPKSASTPRSVNWLPVGDRPGRSIRAGQLARSGEPLVELEQLAARGGVAAVHVLTLVTPNRRASASAAATASATSSSPAAGMEGSTRVHRVVLQHAGRRLAVGVAIDHAAVRVFRRGRDVGHLEDRRVDHGHVPVVAAQEDRAVGDVLVDERRRWAGCRRRCGRGPSCRRAASGRAADLGVERRQACAELGLVLAVLEVDLGEPLAAAQDVGVGVVEAGHDAPAPARNDLRVRAD